MSLPSVAPLLPFCRRVAALSCMHCRPSEPKDYTFGVARAKLFALGAPLTLCTGTELS